MHIQFQSHSSRFAYFCPISATWFPPLPLSQVVEKLQAKYGDLYTNDNVLVSGIHTHSGPAGYFQYVLFEVRASSKMIVVLAYMDIYVGQL